MEYFNETLATINLLILLQMIPFFAKDTMEIIDTDDWVFKVEMVLYILTYWIALSYAAEANNEVTNF